MRTTVYFDDELLNAYDKHIGLVKRSTAISELIKKEIKPKRLNITCPWCGNPDTKELYRHRKDEDFQREARFIYKCLKCDDTFIVSMNFSHCEDPSWIMNWDPDTEIFED